jgi:G:T-mismatch repair DNA endonuclease (very short patch repair protein)
VHARYRGAEPEIRNLRSRLLLASSCIVCEDDDSEDRALFCTDKFAKNVARDARKAGELRKLGWRVLTVWESQCRDSEKLNKRLKRLLAA